MRRLAGVLLLVALAVRPAAGGPMLIASDASDGVLVGFCLNAAGGFVDPATPRVEIPLAGPHPQGLLFVPTTDPGVTDSGTLYVAATDRVEAFRIDDRGRVTHRGRSEIAAGMNVRGLAVSTDTHTLYVAQRGFDRLAAYPLDADGLPLVPAAEKDDRFTSCILGPGGSLYADLVQRDGLLFVSAEAGRVDVFGTLSDGRLCACTVCPDTGCSGETGGCPAGSFCRPAVHDPTHATKKQNDAEECPSTTHGETVTASTPALQRRALAGPASLLVVGRMLYLQEGARHRLAALQIDQLQPPPPRMCVGGANAGKSCKFATETTDCPDGTCSTPKACVAGRNAKQACTIATEKTDCPGSFCGAPRVCLNGPNLGQPCTKAAAATDCAGGPCGIHPPKLATHTNQVMRYLNVKLVDAPEGRTLLASQFFRGRIDGFRLVSPEDRKHCACPETVPECCLPGQQTAESHEDLRMSPVGLTVSSASGALVLYVAAGEDDRVRAYRLGAKGLLQSGTPFSETDERKGSFPNDVTVAMLKSGCS